MFRSNAAFAILLAVHLMASIPTNYLTGQDDELPPVVEDWVGSSPRDEVRPEFVFDKDGGKSQMGSYQIRTDARTGRMGFWTRRFPVSGGQHYRFEAFRRATNVPHVRRSVYARILWLDENGQIALRDEPVVGPYHPPGQLDQTTGEFPPDRATDTAGWTEVSGHYRAPNAARTAVVELHLDWAESAQVEWSDIQILPEDPLPPRKVRLATVHYVPSGKVSPQDNCEQFAPLIREAAEKKADLLVLPETLTHTGTGRTYADIAEAIPGPSTEYFGRLAKQFDIYLVVGLLERVEHVVYNVAVLIGPEGTVVGKYRKVCLPRTEVEAGITPGDDYPVFDTRFGKVGMMICYDGFFPEVARELSNRGAEVIAFPVAGCNPQLAAARACENHAYVVSSTYCGVERNWMVSAVFGHQGEVLAQAQEWGSIAVAEVDLEQPTIWGNIGDFKAQLLRHRPPPPRSLDSIQGIFQPGAEIGKPKTDPVDNRKDPPTARETNSAETDSEATKKRAALDPTATKSPSLPVDAPQESFHEQENSNESLRIPPREPDKALRSFRTTDHFQLQLLAAEPLTTDPITIEYDEHGRAWVIEMSDYPYTDRHLDKPFTDKSSDLPLGRVRVLEDRDDDGVFDHSWIFADQLSWPTGLALWKGGVYVAATPDIWYLKDCDGDGKAEERRKVFTGFRKFNIQAVMNNLRWGIDHHIYGAGGTNGGEITSISHPGVEPLTMAAHDFRFRPQSELFERIAGGARFGLTFDDWGNRFLCNIRNPVRHVAIEERYLSRNPYLAVVSSIHDAAETGDTLPIYRTSPPEPWRVVNAARLAADRSAGSPRSESVSAGFVTSACGITIYRGDAYPEDYYEQVFLGEVAANLIHRQRLTANGMTFHSARIDQRVEWITSDDNWFRPVNFVNAPDGTLHVVDMYRETIEHPWSIPDDIKDRLDLESGRDRGRIYRLAPPNFQYVRPPSLATATSIELVAFLNSGNCWIRETAHRLLFERQDPQVIPALRAILKDSAGDADNRAGARPDLARLHALWTLEGLQALTVEDLIAACDDAVPGIREHAVRLSEPFLREPLSAQQSKLADVISLLANDDHPRVRGQVALSLGDRHDDISRSALASIAKRDAHDRWAQIAVSSTQPDNAARLLERLLQNCGELVPESTPGFCIRSLAMTVGARNLESELRHVLDTQFTAETTDQLAYLRRELLLGLAAGLQRHKLSVREIASRLAPNAVDWVEGLLLQAEQLAVDRSVEAVRRVQALQLLDRESPTAAVSLAHSLLESVEPVELQLAAVQIVGSQGGLQSSTILLESLRRLSPASRSEAVHQMLSRDDWIPMVVDALEQGQLQIRDIPLARRSVLAKHKDPSIRARSIQLFNTDEVGSRKEAVDQYRRATILQGDYERGQQLTKRHCLSCHRMDGLGHDIGPALETVRHRSKAELLLHVLDPNREVAPAFLEYLAAFKDGRTATGMIISESPTAILLRRAEGLEQTILRSELDQLICSGKSLMPEGLEKQLTPQDVADILSVLVGAR